jgi:glucokinase
MEYAIGIDLGGTQLRSIVADRQGTIYHHTRTLTRVAEGPDTVIERMAECIAHARSQVPVDGRLLGVGVGSPGPLNPQTGLIYHAPNMPGWVNIALRDRLLAHCGLPVVVNNDANVAALGEWIFGGGQGYHNLIYITVSTGIGGGIISDGRLLLGRLGVGGEVGYMLLDTERYTAWENLASGTALAAAAAAAMRMQSDSLLHTLTTADLVSARDVALAAEQGDELARSLMQREARLLGLGFTNLLHIFSPELILVGGGVINANPWLLDAAREIVDQHVVADLYRAVPIRPATLHERVGVLGAAALVFYAHDNNQLNATPSGSGSVSGSGSGPTASS